LPDEPDVAYHYRHCGLRLLTIMVDYGPGMRLEFTPGLEHDRPRMRREDRMMLESRRDAPIDCSRMDPKLCRVNDVL
jgi:hypothetical protein